MGVKSLVQGLNAAAFYVYINDVCNDEKNC